MKCDNIATFFGIVIDSDPHALVMEYCARGSLDDLLRFASSELLDDIEVRLFHHVAALACNEKIVPSR